MITDVFRLSLSKFRQSFPLMTYHPIWLITGHLRWTTTDAIGLPGTAYPPGVPGFSHGYWVSQYLVFCVVLLSFACLLVVFPLAIVLSVLFDSRLLITHRLSSKLLLRVGLNEDATFTGTCNRNQFLLSCIGPLVLYCSQTLLNYLAFQYFYIELTRWRLFQKRIARIKSEIYVFITLEDKWCCCSVGFGLYYTHL